MRFPQVAVILRPQGADEYGNPTTSFTNAQRITTKALILRDDVMFLPAQADVRPGDRMEAEGRIYEAEPVAIRTPSGVKMWKVGLRALDVQP